MPVFEGVIYGGCIALGAASLFVSVRIQRRTPA